MAAPQSQAEQVRELRQALRQRTLLLIAVSIQAFAATAGLAALAAYLFYFQTDYLQTTIARGNADYLARLDGSVSDADRARFIETLTRIRAAVDTEGIVAKDRYLEPILYLGEMWESDGLITPAELQLFFQKVELAEAIDRQRRGPPGD